MNIREKLGGYEFGEGYPRHYELPNHRPSPWLLAASAWSALPLLIGLWIVDLGATQFGWEYARAAFRGQLVVLGLGLLPTMVFVAGRRFGALRWQIAAGFAAAKLAWFAPAIACLMLPWEEPETGYGSPMASLLSVAMLGVMCVVAFHTSWALARRAPGWLASYRRSVALRGQDVDKPMHLAKSVTME